MDKDKEKYHFPFPSIVVAPETFLVHKDYPQLSLYQKVRLYSTRHDNVYDISKSFSSINPLFRSFRYINFCRWMMVELSIEKENLLPSARIFLGHERYANVTMPKWGKLEGEWTEINFRKRLEGFCKLLQERLAHQETVKNSNASDPVRLIAVQKPPDEVKTFASPTPQSDHPPAATDFSALEEFLILRGTKADQVVYKATDDKLSTNFHDQASSSTSRKVGYKPFSEEMVDNRSKFVGGNHVYKDCKDFVAAPYSKQYTKSPEPDICAPAYNGGQNKSDLSDSQEDPSSHDFFDSPPASPVFCKKRRRMVTKKKKMKEDVEILQQCNINFDLLNKEMNLLEPRLLGLPKGVDSSNNLQLTCQARQQLKISKELQSYLKSIHPVLQNKQVSSGLNANPMVPPNMRPTQNISHSSKKQFYSGSNNDVKNLWTTDDKILQEVGENEIFSNSFNVEMKSTKPVSENVGLIPLKVLEDIEGLEMNQMRNKLMKNKPAQAVADENRFDNNNFVDFKAPTSKDKKPKSNVEARTSWESMSSYVEDSQSGISDTQICRVLDEIEPMISSELSRTVKKNSYDKRSERSQRRIEQSRLKSEKQQFVDIFGSENQNWTDKANQDVVMDDMEVNSDILDLSFSSRDSKTEESGIAKDWKTTEPVHKETSVLKTIPPVFDIDETGPVECLQSTTSYSVRAEAYSESSIRKSESVRKRPKATPDHYVDVDKPPHRKSSLRKDPDAALPKPSTPTLEFPLSEPTFCVEGDIPDSRKGKYDKTQSIGFKTGTGRNVSVSEAAMAKVRPMFLDEFCEQDNTTGVNKSSEMEIRASKTPISEMRARNADDSEAIDCSAMKDIKTASIKKISKKIVSEPRTSIFQYLEIKTEPSAIAEADEPKSISIKKRSENIDPLNVTTSTELKNDSMCQDLENDDKVFVFSSRENFDLEKDSMKSDQVTDIGMSRETQSAGVQNQPIGFKTGSGKIVRVSKSALTKVKKLFDEPSSLKEKLEGEKDLIKSDCATESLPSGIPFAMEAVAEAAQNQPVGFKTGSGKVVKISKSALTRAETLFNEPSPINENLESGSMISDQFTEPLPPDIPFAMKRLSGDGGQNQSVGFKTGSGKVVTVSKSTITQVKTLFNEPPSINEKLDKEKDPIISVFATEPSLNITQQLDSETVSESDISVFQDSVSQTFFADELEDKGLPTPTNTCQRTEEQEMPKNVFVGFKTCLGNAVNISEAALSNANKLFADEPLCDDADHHLKKESDEATPKKLGKFRWFAESGTNNKIKECDTAVSETATTPHRTSADKPDFSNETVSSCINISIQESRLDVEEAKNSNTVLSQSYSALLEDTDWDEEIIPEWLLNDPPIDIIQKNDLLCKRSASFDSEKPVKKVCVLSNYVREKRHKARELQKELKNSKKNVKPLKGTYLLVKERESLTPWRKVIPDGPENLTRSQLEALGIRDSVLDVTAENALSFCFEASDLYRQSSCDENINGFPVGDGFLLIYDDSNKAGSEEFEASFLAADGVDPNLIPEGWVNHHYGMIVWKLACYERSCSSVWARRALTPHNVMHQLKYRYDREIDRSHSSSLKRILQKDDSAAKPIVLCVHKINKLIDGYSLILTDGWYSCPAEIDVAMSRLIDSQTIRTGTKLLIMGAELLGCDDGVAPLEIPSTVFLRIHTNSSRRVRWWVKLGFYPLSTWPATGLGSILPGGRMIARIDVLVVRSYPLIFVERTDGRNVIRNARAEQKVASRCEQELEKIREKLSNEIAKELSEKKPCIRIGTRNKFSAERLSAIKNPEELKHLLDTCGDPARLESLLSEDQKRAYLEYQRNLFSSTLEQKLRELKMTRRNVSAVLRVKVADGKDLNSLAMLSWWNPSDEILSAFEEGRSLSLYNISPGNSRLPLYLNSTRQSRIVFLPKPRLLTNRRKVLRPRDITTDFQPVLDEVDIIGLVVFIHDNIAAGSKMRIVYLTDTDFRSFFGLVFWRGLEEFCCEDVLVEGRLVCAFNVQWRKKSTMWPIPCGYLSETTMFSLNPRSSAMQHALLSLTHELENKDVPNEIIQCQEVIKDLLESSPSTVNTSANSSVNTSVNYGCDSPMPMKLDLPCATSTPQRGTNATDKRVEKLQKYGRPMNLSPLHCKVGRSSAFKPPTRIT